MNTAKKITLVSKSYTYDDIGQAVETEAYTYPFAWVRSASAREEEQAEDGLRREYVFDVRLTNYNGENELEYNGIRYTVYRTFLNADKGVMELYTQRRVGT